MLSCFISLCQNEDRFHLAQPSLLIWRCRCLSYCQWCNRHWNLIWVTRAAGWDASVEIWAESHFKLPPNVPGIQFAKIWFQSFLLFFISLLPRLCQNQCGYILETQKLLLDAPSRNGPSCMIYMPHEKFIKQMYWKTLGNFAHRMNVFYCEKSKSWNMITVRDSHHYWFWFYLKAEIFVW